MTAHEIPDNLRYTAEHEWVRLDEAGVARIGITAFAQDALGDVVFVTLPDDGAEVSPEVACGEVESTKSVSDIFAPIAGTVSARNGDLDATPELVNSSPYGDGWMFEVQVQDPAAVDALLDAAAYRALLG